MRAKDIRAKYHHYRLRYGGDLLSAPGLWRSTRPQVPHDTGLTTLPLGQQIRSKGCPTPKSNS